MGLEAARKERRSRMSGEEIDAKILEALENAPEGLSQIAISEASGVSYASVVKWIKENPEAVRIVGERKAKKVIPSRMLALTLKRPPWGDILWTLRIPHRSTGRRRRNAYSGIDFHPIRHSLGHTKCRNDKFKAFSLRRRRCEENQKPRSIDRLPPRSLKDRPMRSLIKKRHGASKSKFLLRYSNETKHTTGFPRLARGHHLVPSPFRRIDDTSRTRLPDSAGGSSDGGR